MLILLPIQLAVYGLILAIDVVLLFAVVRWASSRCPHPLLLAFDQAGARLLDECMDQCDHLWRRLGGGYLHSEGCRLGALMVAMFMMRVVLGFLLAVMI